MCFAVVLADSTLGDRASVYLWSADPQDHIWPRGTAVARKTGRGYVQTVTHKCILLRGLSLFCFRDEHCTEQTKNIFNPVKRS